MTRTKNAGQRKNIDGAFTEMGAEASYKRHMGTIRKSHLFWVLGGINYPMISDDC